MSFTPIIQRSIPELVANRLLAMIRSGELKPGERLPGERELASLLDVGRPAVREAIRGLALLGLLKIRQGEGTFVGTLEAPELLEPLALLIDLNPGTIDNLFDARLVIETGVAAAAATAITPAALARLTAAVSDAALLIHDPEAFAAADLAFHETIIAACDNPLLRIMAESLYHLGRKSRQVTAHLPQVTERSLADHRAILAALAAGDGPAAAAAMGQHLTRVRAAWRATAPALP